MYINQQIKISSKMKEKTVGLSPLCHKTGSSMFCLLLCLCACVFVHAHVCMYVPTDLLLTVNKLAMSFQSSDP